MCYSRFSVIFCIRISRIWNCPRCLHEILFACFLSTRSSVHARVHVHAHAHLFVLVSRHPIETTITNPQTSATTITHIAIPDTSLATPDIILIVNFWKVTAITSNPTEVTVARFVAFVEKPGMRLAVAGTYLRWFAFGAKVLDISPATARPKPPKCGPVKKLNLPECDRLKQPRPPEFYPQEQA